MKVDQPVQPKVEQAPSPELKMEGPAGDGPSAFAGGKITSDDISKLGTGKTAPEKTGGLFNPYTGYANLLKGDLQRYLAKQANLRRRRYVVEVRVWVLPSGALKRFELVGSTSDPDTDQALQAAIEAMPVFSQAPPPNMPQPILLRINTNS
jgi:protein TonB